MWVDAITYLAMTTYVVCIGIIWMTAKQMRQHWKMWIVLSLIPMLLITTGIIEIQEAKKEEAHAIVHGMISLSTAIALVIWVYTLRQLQKTLDTKARYDDLTGLLRRDTWISATEREISRATRSHQPIAVIEFDIDDFKHVNDTYGHATGDHLLKTIAHLCTSSSRPSDILGRIGGEEFMLTLPETDLEQATSIAKRLCDLVSQHPFHIGESIISATISLGIVTSGSRVAGTHQNYPDLPSLMKSADEAMYQAKAAGKNCVRLHDPSVELA